ncbi:hypothetical protein G7046_g1786 [Stylonectria norvegica]|nr:hypothetical protein G7046_g1786 [Stylonectria norvegica]
MRLDELIVMAMEELIPVRLRMDWLGQEMRCWGVRDEVRDREHEVDGTGGIQPKEVQYLNDKMGRPQPTAQTRSARRQRSGVQWQFAVATVAQQPRNPANFRQWIRPTSLEAPLLHPLNLNPRGRRTPGKPAVARPH